MFKLAWLAVVTTYWLAWRRILKGYRRRRGFVEWDGLVQDFVTAARGF